MHFPGVACDAADKVCGCSSKGSSACDGAPNSSCDRRTDSCVCNSGHFNNNGACDKTTSSDQQVTDGHTLSPFSLSVSTDVNWEVIAGSDHSAYGIPSNGFYILAEGNVCRSSSCIVSCDINDHFNFETADVTST